MRHASGRHGVRATWDRRWTWNRKHCSLVACGAEGRQLQRQVEELESTCAGPTVRLWKVLAMKLVALLGSKGERATGAMETCGEAHP